MHDDSATALAHCCDESGEGGGSEKPTVDRVEETTHKSSRSGTAIDHIVLHYTTSRNIEGSIRWFKIGNPRTSAHYIIGQDGALVQMVPDSHNAWHAGNGQMNRRSIGIEHVAAVGDKITTQQEAKSLALIRWLMLEYNIPVSRVIAHACVRATSCPGDLFADYGGKAGAACEVHGLAIQRWLTEKGIV